MKKSFRDVLSSLKTAPNHITILTIFGILVYQFKK